MTELYPLRFVPIFKERVWGGRRLERWFQMLPPGPIGEAWVLGDHPQGQTPVANGPLAGQRLGALCSRYGEGLLGRRGTANVAKGFPLLFKLLDCQDDLSIQVHPADGYAGLAPGELGKTEMWVVLAAEPGSQVVYGLKDGVTREDLAAALAQNRPMDVMRQVTVQVGDVLYVPAGTIHALGRGLMVAEIQQSSDTTYRVYDYNRPGLDGKPRELHVDHALAVTRYGAAPQVAHPPKPDPGQWAEICRSPYFTVYRGRWAGRWDQSSNPETFQVIIVLEGMGRIEWSGGRMALVPGSTVLVPAALGPYRLAGACEALLVTL